MMLLLPASILLTLFVCYLACSTAYLIVLALASVLIKESPRLATVRERTFAVLIPAHNEEMLIGRLLKSLLTVRYPSDRREIFVIADNCSDRTAQIVRDYPVTLLVRNDESRLGKGFAIKHALENITPESFDAVLIIDADNVVDEAILSEVNLLLDAGYEAIQCHNAVANRNDSWFAELLCVSRTISNQLYHHGKHKLGLSSYLMGNGICFTTRLLKDRPWTAFSLGEDWEYYGVLMEAHVKVGFALRAKVFHQESRSLDQATSQRLRWAKGRFDIGKKIGTRLLLKGLHRRDWLMVDSSLPFIFPNYSLQVNLTVVALLLCLLIPSLPLKRVLLAGGLACLMGQLGLFFWGMALAGEFRRSLAALVRAPLFLAWKSGIDLVSVTGLYKGEKWIRTRRHSPAATDATWASMQKKQTVLAFVVWTLSGMGGSEKVVFDIARKADRSRYRIVILSFCDGPVRQNYERIGAIVRVIDATSRIARLRRLRRVIRDERIEIINPHHFGPLLYSFVAGLGLSAKYIYTEHSRWQLEQLPLAWKLVNRFIVRRLAGVVALSRQIEDHYANEIGLDRGRIHLIPNGVEADGCASLPAAELRRDMGIAPDEKVIGTVAHLRPEKNHKVLISAFEMLLRRGLNGRLVLVGRDMMNGEIRRFAASLKVSDMVLFLGEQDNAATLMKAFDVFCLPSLYEGMPLTVLEAMVSRVPVVGSDVLGINEIVKDGRNGLLFATNDAHQLAEHLETVLCDQVLRKRLASAGRDYVLQNYSLDVMIARYDYLFSSLVNRPPGEKGRLVGASSFDAQITVDA